MLFLRRVAAWTLIAATLAVAVVAVVAARAA